MTMSMLSSFVSKRLRDARYKLLGDGSYFGEIPSLKGVWANAKNIEDCRKELKSALEDWILFSVKESGSIPGLRIGTDRRKMLKHA